MGVRKIWLHTKNVIQAIIDSPETDADGNELKIPASRISGLAEGTAALYMVKSGSLSSPIGGTRITFESYGDYSGEYFKDTSFQIHCWVEAADGLGIVRVTAKTAQYVDVVPAVAGTIRFIAHGLRNV